MPIPSQAAEDTGPAEGVETRRVSSNNNPAQERPTTSVDKTSQVCYTQGMSNTWEDKDDDFLRDNYVRQGVKWCAVQLGRTPGAVANRACRIGLGKMKSETYQARVHRGYIQVVLGSYRVMLHRLIGEMKLGRALRSNEVVHHIDGDTLNNHPDNLEVLTNAEHQRKHWGENCDGRRDQKSGRFTHG